MDLAGRFGPMVNSNYSAYSVGSLAGLEADWRLEPHFRLGAYFQWVGVEAIASESRDLGQDFSATRFGLEFEAHSRPLRIVDPWAGVMLGGFDARRPPFRLPELHAVGVDAGLDAGLDFHLGAGVTLGAILTVVVPLTSTAVFGTNDAKGGAYYSWFFDFPIPHLRVAFAL